MVSKKILLFCIGGFSLLGAATGNLKENDEFWRRVCKGVWMLQGGDTGDKVVGALYNVDLEVERPDADLLGRGLFSITFKGDLGRMNNKELNRFVRKLEKRAERKDEELKKLLKESVNDNFPWWCCCCATRAQKRKFISDFKKKNKNRYRLYLETAYKVKRQQDRARD